MGEGRLVPYRFKASGQMRAAHAMVARGTTVMGRASAVAMGGRPPGATPIVLTATPSTRYSHRARDVVECRPDGVYKHALVAHSVGEVFALCSAPVLYVIGGWATVHAFMPYASAVHRFVLQDVVPTEPTPHAPHFHFDPRPPPQLLNIEAGLIVEEYRGSPYRLETWHLAPERLPPPPRSRSAIRSRRLAAPRGKRAMRRVRPSSTPPIPDDDPLYYRWAPSALGPALSRAHRPTTAQAAHPPSSSSLSTAFDAAFEADLERAIRQSLEEAGMVDVDLVGVDSDSPLMDWTVVENHDATDARPTRRSPPPSDALFALNVRCKVIIAGIQHDLRDAQDRSSYIGRPPLGCLVERTARVDRAITWNVVRHLRPVDVLCLARASPYVPRILAEIADSLWASREMDPRDDAPPWRAVVSTVERGHVRPRGATRRGLAVARAWLRVVVMAGVEAPDRPIGASLPRYRGTRASATDAYHNKYVLAAACAARVGCDRVLYECVESSIRSNGYNDRSLPALSMARAGGTMRSAVALGVACGIAEYNASAMRHFYDADDDSVAMEMGERAGAPAERFVQAVLATVTLGIVCSLAPPAPGAPSGVIRGAKRSGADVPSSASLWTNDAAFYVEAAGHLEGTMRLLVEGASVRRGLVDECGPAALRMARLVAGALEDLSATPPPSRSSRKAQRTATIWRRRVGDALECIGTLASTMKRILAPTDEGPDVHARLSSRAQRHILEEIDLMTALAQHEPDLVFGDMIPHLSVTDRVALASTNRCMLLMVAEHARRAAVPRNRPVSDAHERACRMWDEVVESVPLIAAHDETGVEPVRRAIATVILRLCVLPLVEGLVHSVERATNGACGSVATMPCSTEPLYANTIRVPERLIAALVHSVYTRDRDGIGRCADASHRLGRCIDRLWEHAHPTYASSFSSMFPAAPPCPPKFV
jgi:hypothetical protein